MAAPTLVSSWYFTNARRTARCARASRNGLAQFPNLFRSFLFHMSLRCGGCRHIGFATFLVGRSHFLLQRAIGVVQKLAPPALEIGRASCRERVCQYV